ncbi:MAG: hypothetical protein KC777_02200 [Cyanobacteria bacterium HKST-UBA02]|nr:hypothetical protein [Cyanobacteria bacterium HKST-UBA02]
MFAKNPRQALILLLFLWLAQPACFCADKGDVWIVDYGAGLITAPSRIYLGADAIKITTTGGNIVVARAPVWDATMVNESTKTIFEHRAANWQKNGFFLERNADRDEFNRKKTVSDEKLTFRGLASRRLVWKTMHSDDFYMSRAKPQVCMVELVETKAIPCSKMQIEVLSAWYGIKNLDGVPLYWVEKLPKRNNIRLKAMKIARVPASQVSFKPPAGMRKVSSMFELNNRQKLTNTLHDIFGLEESDKK